MELPVAGPATRAMQMSAWAASHDSMRVHPEQALGVLTGAIRRCQGVRQLDRPQRRRLGFEHGHEAAGRAQRHDVVEWRTP